MIDTSQILIVAAITVMTVLITVLGIQLIFIFKDVRQILKRVNTMTAELEKMGMNLSGSYTEILGFVGSVKKLLSVLDYVSERKKSK
jgi:hypothetical protein